MTQLYARNAQICKIFAAVTTLAVTLGALIVLDSIVRAQGTVAPSIYQVVSDSSGNPIVGAKVCTYLAGTTTLTPTYTSSTLAVENSNPIITDASGRWTAFLSPGASYKWIVYSNDGTAATCDGTVLKTQDNISAVPMSAANVDVNGVAGEAITAGQAVYLSDGSGSKVAGSWYLTDATYAYASTLPVVGIAPSEIVSGATGAIRLKGSLTTLSGLVPGSTYYLSAATPGAITTTAPANARYMGRASAATTLTVADFSGPVPADVVCGRLTLTSTVPVTTASVSSATTVYYTPDGCNIVSLYDGTALWNNRIFTELSATVPAYANKNYDLFIVDSAGVPTIEVSSAWATTTSVFSTGTYQTSRPRQDGRYVQSTNGTAIDATRRYVGSFRTEAAAGYTNDTERQRFLFNMYHRAPRVLKRLETVTSWTYTTATYRQARANAYNQVEILAGVSEEPVDLTVTANASNGSAAVIGVTIGVDSTNASTTQPIRLGTATAAGSGLSNRIVVIPGLGYHYFAWLELSQATGTTNWFSAASMISAAYGDQSGLLGTVRQ